jgi:nitroreductase
MANEIFNFSMRQSVSSSRLIAGWALGQWADLGGYISTLALLARGYGLDSCPQMMWIRVHKMVGAILKLQPEQMLYCGIAIGYGDRDHPIKNFRRTRAALDEFCKTNQKREAVPDRISTFR